MSPLMNVLKSLAVLIGLLTATQALAAERILKFVSNVDVAPDGVLTVTETITVRAEGNQIKRGIFRDIPLTAENSDGRTYKVGFKLLDVLQDGKPAAHFQNANANGTRIYIGEERVFLSPGTYTYTIKYETDRQIRFFENQDEVYWNATGNEWAFPIDKAFARIVLPAGATAKDWTAYTGQFGATGQDFTARVEDNASEIVFQATRGLRPYEGLTVVLSLPKGVVAAPSQSQKLSYFLSDHRAELIGSAGGFMVLAYYLLAWLAVGRDPAKGVVFPRFKAPAGISPALAKYIDHRGFGDGGWVALSAACLNLAVKGRLRLDQSGEDVTLSLDEAANSGRFVKSGLPRGEAAVAGWLDNRGSSLPLNSSNGVSIKALGKTFRTAIEKENRDVFFKSNRAYLVPGVLLSVATIIALLAGGGLSGDQEGFVVVFLVFSIFATVFAVNLGKFVFRLRSMKLRMGLIFGFFAVAMTVACYGAHNVTGGFQSTPVLPFVAIALAAVNILFFFLMGAPTALGRQTLDEIEGLRLYLSVAEKERLNMADIPNMSTEHFEALLPYAVALGVEKPWSKAFEGWLVSAAGAAAASNYHPHWYSGRTFDPHHVSDSLGETASAMAGSFQSSLPVPKSSSSGFSSGGGGFSGGGGGGGGGGGW